MLNKKTTLVTAVTTTGVMLLLFLPEGEEKTSFNDGKKDEEINHIYRSITYHADINIKKEFQEVHQFESSAPSIGGDISSRTTNFSKDAAPEHNGQTTQADTAGNIQERPVKLEPIGTLDMNAQGRGEGLQVSLSISNGKLQIDQCASIPKSVTARRKIHASNHLVIFKDSNEEELLAKAVQFHKLRAPLPEFNTRETVGKDADYEEYTAVMSFVKFPRKAKFLEIYSFEKPYVPETGGDSVRKFIKDSGQTLKLTHRGLLK